MVARITSHGDAARIAAGDFRLVARAVFDRYDDVVFRSADEWEKIKDRLSELWNYVV